MPTFIVPSTPTTQGQDQDEIAPYTTPDIYEDAPSQPNPISTTPKSASQLLLTDDPFSNSVSKQLFDAIDELRKCGAGRDLDIPQLVIVGKQSSGKSSLLESLTDIPFPTESNTACTRFATRIVSKRTPPDTVDIVNVSIETNDIGQSDMELFGYDEDDSRVGNFNPSVSSMTGEVFADIMKQASKVMGISGEKNFSSKVLKIELSGPERSHFAILDLPGVFDTKFKSLTLKEAAGVKQLVTSYMKQPQNIIICIADASSDPATHGIFTLAHEHIPDTQSMVGVFTKCDKLDDAEAEEVVRIVRDNDMIGGKADNGWFVVRNRGSAQQQLSSTERLQQETKLFSTHPWSKISEQRRGTSMLKKFLANLLCRRIREAFPEMQKTVISQLQAEHKNQRVLGDPRSTHHQRQEYLRTIAQRFNILAQQALRSPTDLPSDDLKLRGLVHTNNDLFVRELKDNGHFYQFSDIPLEVDSARTPPAKQSPDVFTFGQTPPHTPSPVRSKSSKSSRNSRILVPESPVTSPLYTEIQAQITANRGEELPGMTNPAILKPLMRKQTRKWEKHATQHFNRVAFQTTDIAVHILHTVCEEQNISDHTKRELESLIRDFGAISELRYSKKISVMCQAKANGPIQTNNASFLDKVTASQVLRFKAALARYRQRRPAAGFFAGNEEVVKMYPDLLRNLEPFVVMSPQCIMELFDQLHPSRQQNTEDEIHDLLKAYYEVSREDFIHDVTDRIIEPYLNDPEGPLMGFSSDLIMKELSEERIEELGGEDENAILSRKATEEKIRRLEMAMEISRNALRKTRVVV